MTTSAEQKRWQKSERISAALKAAWNKPGAREKYSAAIKAAWAKQRVVDPWLWSLSPEMKALRQAMLHTGFPEAEVRQQIDALHEFMEIRREPDPGATAGEPVASASSVQLPASCSPTLPQGAGSSLMKGHDL